MSFHIYRSTDAGAPELWSAAGSLIALLDAVLVNGYGSGGSASAAAGWEIAYSDTDVRVYRSTDPAGTRYYYRVDDTDPDGVALVRGYESMSDIDTGTVPFPTTAQNASGVDFAHDTGIDGTAHRWTALADARTVVIAVANNVFEVDDASRLFYFGEIGPINAQQPTDAVIGGSGYPGSTSSTVNALVRLVLMDEDLASYLFAPGAAWSDQTVGGVTTGWHIDGQDSRMGGADFISSSVTTPHPVSDPADGLVAIPNFATAPSRIVGRLRGIYNAPHGLIDDEAQVKELGNINGRRAVGVPIFGSGHCLFLDGVEP